MISRCVLFFSFVLIFCSSCLVWGGEIDQKLSEVRALVSECGIHSPSVVGSRARPGGQGFEITLDARPYSLRRYLPIFQKAVIGLYEAAYLIEDRRSLRFGMNNESRELLRAIDDLISVTPANATRFLWTGPQMSAYIRRYDFMIQRLTLLNKTVTDRVQMGNRLPMARIFQNNIEQLKAVDPCAWFFLR